jgi:hypothetical protein
MGGRKGRGESGDSTCESGDSTCTHAATHAARTHTHAPQRTHARTHAQRIAMHVRANAHTRITITHARAYTHRNARTHARCDNNRSIAVYLKTALRKPAQGITSASARPRGRASFANLGHICVRTPPWASVIRIAAASARPQGERHPLRRRRRPTAAAASRPAPACVPPTGVKHLVSNVRAPQGVECPAAASARRPAPDCVRLPPQGAIPSRKAPAAASSARLRRPQPSSTRLRPPATAGRHVPSRKAPAAASELGRIPRRKAQAGACVHKTACIAHAGCVRRGVRRWPRKWPPKEAPSAVPPHTILTPLRKAGQRRVERDKTSLEYSSGARKAGAAGAEGDLRAA